jgi:hypothetical protein
MSANANAATCIYSVIGHVAVEYIIHTEPGGQAGKHRIISQKAALVACGGETQTRAGIIGRFVGRKGMLGGMVVLLMGGGRGVRN